MQTILNVPECEFREYAKDHTPTEIAQHFGKNQTTVRVALSQKHIPHKERVLLKNDNNKCSPKRTGLTVDMIRTLSEFYFILRPLKGRDFFT